MNNVKIEKITVDGKQAERHTTIGPDGTETIEIFVEQQVPLKLEKRIILEKKSVVARETTETLRDGEVVNREVKEIDDSPLQKVKEQPVQKCDDYVRKDEIAQMIADGVVAGISAAFVDKKEPEKAADWTNLDYAAKSDVEPTFNAQALLEQKVGNKKDSSLVGNIVVGVLITANIAFLLYYVLVIM
jgi:hypothetical protein